MIENSPLDSTSRHPFAVTTGRRATDERLRVELFSKQMLAISIEGRGDEWATRLLTIEQAQILRDSLTELIRVAEEMAKDTAVTSDTLSETWSGEERRASA